MLEVAQVQHRPERGVWIRWSTFEHLRDGGTTGDDRWQLLKSAFISEGPPLRTAVEAGDWKYLEMILSGLAQDWIAYDSMVPCILSPAESTCFFVLISLDIRLLYIDYTRLLYCLTKICYTTNCYSIIRGCWLLLDGQFEPVTDEIDSQSR